LNCHGAKYGNALKGFPARGVTSVLKEEQEFQGSTWDSILKVTLRNPQDYCKRSAGVSCHLFDPFTRAAAEPANRRLVAAFD
jgi:hypothetical protein